MRDNSIITVVKQKEAILFDLFHTLTNVESSWSAGPSSCEMLGVSKEAWHEQVMEKSRERLAGEITDPVLIMRKMAHSIDPAIPEDVIKKAVINRIKRFYEALVNIPEETRQVLTTLKSMNKKTGLISNADVTEIVGWKRSGVAHLFDSVVFSCNVGCVKPEPQIYEICMEELDVKPRQCLFVGDGGSRELEGAKNLGITTVMITGVISEIWPDKIDERKRYADYVIERLNELVT
jgi:putative hydrolase of the HAD superfamily